MAGLLDGEHMLKMLTTEYTEGHGKVYSLLACSSSRRAPFQCFPCLPWLKKAIKVNTLWRSAGRIRGHQDARPALEARNRTAGRFRPHILPVFHRLQPFYRNGAAVFARMDVRQPPPHQSRHPRIRASACCGKTFLPCSAIGKIPPPPHPGKVNHEKTASWHREPE